MTKPPGPARMGGGKFLLICLIVAVTCSLLAFWLGIT